jgi:hypothetical protein
VLPHGRDGHNENVKDNLRAMATETMAIIEAGGYRSPDGTPIHAAFAPLACLAAGR